LGWSQPTGPRIARQPSLSWNETAITDEKSSANSQSLRERMSSCARRIAAVP
jgi:hypothetical protein